MAGGIQTNRKLLLLNELPPCDGPRLHVFKYRRAPIEWLELLEKSSPESHSASQGYVFKVKINSKIYALKVFKFFKPSTDRYLLSDIAGQNVTNDELAFHTDPFYAECRAYGQIKKAEEKRRQESKWKIAARCHGFMPLKKNDELILAARGIDVWEDIPEDDEYRKLAEGSPIRAIVKDYVEDEEKAMTLPTLKAILKNVRAMNKQGILHRDIRASNFKAGLVVDFGSAWTEPHCIMDAVPPHVSEDWKWTDLRMFDDMVEEEGFSLDSIRALPNTSYLKKLRSWN